MDTKTLAETQRTQGGQKAERCGFVGNKPITCVDGYGMEMWIKILDRIAWCITIVCVGVLFFVFFTATLLAIWHGDINWILSIVITAIFALMMFFTLRFWALCKAVVILICAFYALGIVGGYLRFVYTYSRTIPHVESATAIYTNMSLNLLRFVFFFTIYITPLMCYVMIMILRIIHKRFNQQVSLGESA